MAKLQTIRGSQFGRLNDRRLRKVFLRWRKLIETLAKNWASESSEALRDCPWWYLERTSVGFLAGAVWLCGGEAIEEYSTIKSFRNRRGTLKKGSGRGDLRMYIGKNGDQDFVVEAKQCPSHLEAGKEQIKKDIKKYLYKGAVKDAVSAKADGEAQKLGIAFLVPWSSKPPNGKAIREWVDMILSVDSKVSAIWTFPGVARTIKYRDNDGKFYYCPGVLLLAKRPRS